MAAQLEPRLAKAIRDCPKSLGWRPLAWSQNRTKNGRGALLTAQIVPVTIDIDATGYQGTMLIRGTWESTEGAMGVQLALMNHTPVMRVCVSRQHGDGPGWHWRSDAFGEESEHESVSLLAGTTCSPEYLLYEIFCKALNIEEYQPEGNQTWT